MNACFVLNEQVAGITAVRSIESGFKDIVFPSYVYAFPVVGVDGTQLLQK